MNLKKSRSRSSKPKSPVKKQPKKQRKKQPVKATKKRRATVTVKQRENSEQRKRRLANLRPFKPGQSGNPAGRPKSITVSEALRRLLEEEIAKGKTGAEVLANGLYSIATKGRGGNVRVRAIHEIIDRVEGKPKQEFELDVTKLTDEELDTLISTKSTGRN